MGRPLRALILEDSPLDFELLLRALRGEGFDVTPRRVENVRELREAIANERWDVVLSDYSMPELSVPISLRVLQEQQVDVPFIIVSGSVGEESAVDAMKAGAHDFFLKDRLARLGSAIDRELREAETRRQRRAADARLKESEQQLRQALQARDEFLRIASHELRTPLTPLALELQTALDLAHRLPAAQPAPELEKLESKLAKAVRNVERLKTLIENLLDVTRIASGELTLSRERVDLCETVTRLTDRLRGPRHPTADIALRCEGPVVGDWDPIAIESAVNNLLA